MYRASMMEEDKEEESVTVKNKHGTYYPSVFMVYPDVDVQFAKVTRDSVHSVHTVEASASAVPLSLYCRPLKHCSEQRIRKQA